jgi:hypothetical protein
MTDFPDLKIKALINFPTTTTGGAGVDVTNANGNYVIDLAYDDFAPPVSGVSDATHQTILVWNTATGQYTLTPISLLGGGGGVPEAPTDGQQYGRQFVTGVSSWTPVSSSGGGSGNVTGPAGAVANNIVTFNGTTGLIIKDGGQTIASLYPASNPAGYVTAAAAAAAAPVQSVATRTGAVTLTHSDITDWAASLASYAPLASPALTGTPSAPTAAPATSTTQIATTAFVAAAVSASGGVTPSALSRTNDANVTLTLGGTPNTALLQATSITVGWTGQLATARGGFGIDVSTQSGVPVFAAGVPTFTATTGAGNLVTTSAAVRYDTSQALTSDTLPSTSGQRTQARANIYAAPFDAVAFNGLQFNGSMDLSQENSTTSVAISSGSPKYIVDGFGGALTGTGAAFGQQTAITTLPGYLTCLSFSCSSINSLAGASDLQSISHAVEGYRWARLGYGFAGAQPVSIGFWISVGVSGTIAVAIRNAASTRSYVVDVPVTTGGWQYKTVTIPGDAAGTWSIGPGLVGAMITFCFGAGSALKTAANIWTAGNFIATSATTNFFASTGAAGTNYLTGVTVIPGLDLPGAARAQFLIRPFDQELAIAQRYFYNGVPPARGVFAGGQAARLGCRHPVKMCKVPAIGITTALPLFDGSTTTTSSGTPTNYATVDNLEFSVGSAVAMAAGAICMVYQTGSGNMNVDARL